MHEILYLFVVVFYLCIFLSCYRVRTLAEPSIELSDIEAGLQTADEDEDKLYEDRVT